MKLIRYFLLGLGVLAGAGAAFYFYNPELSPETERWVAMQNLEYSEEKASRLKALDELINYEGDLPEPCKFGMYSASCARYLLTAEPIPVTPEQEVLFREALDLWPQAWGGEYFLGPSSTSQRWAVNYSYLASFSDNREANTERLIYYLSQTNRMFHAEASIMDFLLGTGVYVSALKMANVILARGVDPTNPEVAAFLEPLRLTEESWQRKGAQELRHAKYAVTTYGAFSRFDRIKMSWHLDNIRYQLEYREELINQSPYIYWTEEREFHGHWFMKWYDKLWRRDFPLEYQEDVLLAKRALRASLLLRALSQVYQGNDVTDHGVPAPEGLVWQWREDTGELCLQLVDELRTTELANEQDVCMPNIQYLMELG